MQAEYLVHDCQLYPDDMPWQHIPCSPGQAETWSLVLTALDIPHRLTAEQGTVLLTVAPAYLSMALTQVSAYEEENRNWPPVRVLHHAKNRTESTVWTLLALTAAMGMTFLPEFHELRMAGAACASRIMHDEWWRAVTALTLHSDPAHLMGNMFIGGFIMVQACNYMGSGLTWFLTIWAGFAGNFLNAMIQPPSHISVGSSTAVFGLLGMLTAFRAIHDGTLGRPREFLLPLGAGIALLGFTGTAGAHTDQGAHLCGFISGVAAGLAAGSVVRTYGFPSRKTSRLLAAFSITVPITAWAAAYLTCP